MFRNLPSDGDLAGRFEKPFPTDAARMEERPGVGQEAVGDIAVPGVLGPFDRHVNGYRSADDVLARHGPPETTVIGVAPIVAHYEIGIRRNTIGVTQRLKAARRFPGGHNFGRSGRVVLL